MKFKQIGYPISHPEPSDILVIIEVSDATYNYDLHVKLPIYATSGIPVCWIINLNRNCIEVYEEPMGDLYRKTTLYLPGDKISILDKSFDVSDVLLVKSE